MYKFSRCTSFVCSLGEVGSNVKLFLPPPTSNSRSATNPLSSTMISAPAGLGGGAAPAAAAVGGGAGWTSSAKSSKTKSGSDGQKEAAKSEDLEVRDLDESSVVSVTPSSEDTLNVDDLCTLSLTELSPNSTLVQAQLDTSSGDGGGGEGEKREGGERRGEDEREEGEKPRSMKSERKETTEVDKRALNDERRGSGGSKRGGTDTTNIEPLQSSAPSLEGHSPPLTSHPVSKTTRLPPSRDEPVHQPASSHDIASQTTSVTQEDNQNQTIPSPSPRDEADGGKDGTASAPFPPAEEATSAAPPEKVDRQTTIPGNLVRMSRIQ